MSADDDGVDWRKLREFRDVELGRSHVLSWSVEGNALLIDVDVRLGPEHAFYERPRPAEKVCVRPAIIEFPYCDAVEIDGVASEGGLSDIVRGLRHGAITGLKRLNDGPFVLYGDFGTVRIDSERPILRLRGV